MMLVLAMHGSAFEAHIQAAVHALQNAKAASSAGSTSTAIELLRQAINIEPTYLDAHHALIDAYLKAGKKTEAAAAITQLLQIEPALINDRLTLARLLLEQHEPRRAFAQFATVLKVESENHDALQGTVQSAQQLGWSEQLVSLKEQGRKLYPRDPVFH